MSFSDWLGLLGLIVGVIGVVVGIIGCFNLSKANKIKVKNISGGTINQAETLIVNNGVDTYAVIKIAKETTQEELKSVVNSLEATTLDLGTLRKEVEVMPKIYSGEGLPPSTLKNGDIYLQYK